MKKVISVGLFLFVLVLMVAPAPLLAQDITCESDVTVQADDWLSKIAEKFYGDPVVFPAIVAATNAKAATDDSYAVLNNPDVIETGWKLCIPSTDDAQVP